MKKELRTMRITSGEAYKEGRAPSHDGEYLTLYAVCGNNEVDFWGLENAGGLDVTSEDGDVELALSETEYHGEDGYKAMIADILNEKPLTQEELDDEITNNYYRELFRDWGVTFND